MSSPRRPYRHRQSRRVWVFSERNVDLRPADVARVLARAALESAAEAHARQVASDPANGSTREDAS